MRQADDGSDIELWRDELGRAQANIAHAQVVLAPTGFEWGYRGAGPGDLALNILLAAGGDERVARRLCQSFMDEYIAGMAKEGGVIPRRTVVQFIRDSEVTS